MNQTLFVLLLALMTASLPLRASTPPENREIELGFFAEDLFSEKLVEVKKPAAGKTLVVLAIQDHCGPCQRHAKEVLCAKQKKPDGAEFIAFRSAGSSEDLKRDWRPYRNIPLVDPGPKHLSRFLPIPGTPVSFVFSGDSKARVFLGARSCDEISGWMTR